jgi:hypothetical protein
MQWMDCDYVLYQTGVVETRMDCSIKEGNVCYFVCLTTLSLLIVVAVVAAGRLLEL